MIPDAPSRPRRQFAISRVMAAIAAVAVALAISRQATAPMDPVVTCLSLLLLEFLVLHLLVGKLIGYPCPHCSRWALRRLARHRRYYQCSACGVRMKRVGLGPWLDAAGPEDAGKYRKDSGSGTWYGYEPPGRLDETPSGHLLEAKQSRVETGEGPWRAPPASSRRRVEDAAKKVRATLGNLRQLRR